MNGLPMSTQLSRRFSNTLTRPIARVLHSRNDLLCTAQASSKLELTWIAQELGRLLDLTQLGTERVHAFRSSGQISAYCVPNDICVLAGPLPGHDTQVSVVS